MAAYPSNSSASSTSTIIDAGTGAGAVVAASPTTTTAATTTTTSLHPTTSLDEFSIVPVPPSRSLQLKDSGPASTTSSASSPVSVYPSSSSTSTSTSYASQLQSAGLCDVSTDQTQNIATSATTTATATAATTTTTTTTATTRTTTAVTATGRVSAAGAAATRREKLAKLGDLNSFADIIPSPSPLPVPMSVTTRSSMATSSSSSSSSSSSNAYDSATPAPPQQHAFSMPSNTLPSPITANHPFLMSHNQDACCLTPKRHMRSRSLAGTLGAPHMSRAHSSPSLVKGKTFPYHYYGAGSAYSGGGGGGGGRRGGREDDEEEEEEEEDFGTVTSARPPHRPDRLQSPILLLATPTTAAASPSSPSLRPRLKRNQDCDTDTPCSHPELHSLASSQQHDFDISSQHSCSSASSSSFSCSRPRSYLDPESHYQAVYPPVGGNSRASNKYAPQCGLSEMTTPPNGPTGGGGGQYALPAKFNEPYPNPLATPSILSSPSTFRSRSPSVSSLETIPDIPDAEAEATALDNEAAQDRKNPWAISVGPTNFLGSSTPRFGNRKDKRKRWSVCGGEKAYDFDLETIWED